MDGSNIDRIEAMAIAWEATSTLALADLAESMIYLHDMGEFTKAADLLLSPDRRPPAPPAELVEWVREYVTVRPSPSSIMKPLPFVLDFDDAVERVVGAFDIRTSTAQRLVSAALDGWEPS